MKPYLIAFGLILIGLLCWALCAAAKRIEEMEEEIYLLKLIFGNPNAEPPKGVIAGDDAMEEIKKEVSQ